ncbi:MAG TPA: hypothetical protein VEH04_16755 [Verrucomicrobiae bacterium]|nr:hypothetical protein [Verrucomicrobiae bacterium]
MLPTSHSGATINPQLALPARSSTTPALQLLAQAFQQGAINFDQINSMFTKAKTDSARRQLADEEILASKDRIEIMPKAKEATNARLDSELQVLPKKTAAILDDLDLRIKSNDVAESDLGRAMADPFRIAELYTKSTGKPPQVKADGTLDLELMTSELDTLSEDSRKRSNTYSDLQINSMRSKTSLTPAQHDLVGTLTKAGYPDAAYNPDGSVKSVGELTQAVAKVRTVAEDKPLTAAQKAEQEQAIVLAESMDADMTRMIELAKASKAAEEGKGDGMNIFGAGVGSPVARGVNSGLAILGSEDARKRRILQTEAEKFVNNLTAEKTQILKGALSNRELEFIKAAVVQIPDDEEVWIATLTKAQQTLRNALAARKSSVGEAPSEAPPAARPAAEDITSLPLVRTAADRQNLPIGTRYRTESGETATRR